MAMMTRCCCFNDTRSGSLAAGIYSLIYAIVLLGFAGWGFSAWNFPWTPSAILAMFYVEFLTYSLVLLGSLLMIVGVSQDIAGLLIPYIIFVVLMMIGELISYAVWLSILGFAAIVLIIPFVIFLIFLGFNIMSVLCAISQFQELSAGRGRACDVAAANNITTIVTMSGQPVMTHPPPGIFVVSQQQQPQVTVVQQGQPGMVQTQAYGQPAYGQPAYGQPAYGQPMQAPPAYCPQNQPMQPAYPPQDKNTTINANASISAN